MSPIKITITSSRCRCGYCREGDEYIVEDLCPPVCHELWNAAYPYVFALLNGGLLDHGDQKAAMFTVKCPDEGRVVMRGERI